MPLPIGLMVALGLAGAASSAASSIASRNTAKDQEKLSRDELALKESTLNPHRNQLAQLRALISLNAARSMPRSATPLSPGGKYASAMPTMPRTSYEALDPSIIGASEALESDVLRGVEAPTFSGKHPAGFSPDLATRIGGAEDPALARITQRRAGKGGRMAARGRLAR